MPNNNNPLLLGGEASDGFLLAFVNDKAVLAMDEPVGVLDPALFKGGEASDGFVLAFIDKAVLAMDEPVGVLDPALFKGGEASDRFVCLFLFFFLCLGPRFFGAMFGYK